MSKSGSLSSGKLSFCFSLKPAWAFTESPLAPRTTTLSLSNCFFASRNSDASMVQPVVLALGKKKSRTRLPRKSERETSLPSSAFTLKSGALSPGFSICIFPSFDTPSLLSPSGYRSIALRSFRFVQQLLQDLVYGLGIGLAASGAHDLADEEFEDAFVAGFVFGDIVGIFGDDFAGGLLDRGSIADLRQAFGGDDFGGAAAGFKHGGEDFFADGAGDLPGFDELQQLGERGGRNRAGADFLAGIVEAAEQFG